MGEEFLTTVLFHDGSSTPAIMKASVPPHYWQKFLKEQSMNVLLAGGFPQLSPDLPFPLSPTLQLNADLTDLSSKELRNLALAELEKANGMNFRCVTHEADTRVCVISQGADILETFCDTYGGLLEIEPLLLKDSHPDIPSAIELNIIWKGSGYQVDFTVRSPFDLDRCTYCGKCGLSCPERCLLEKPAIDYSRCSWCRQCETVCPTQAIDIATVETRTLRIPAILILGDVQLDLPREGKGLFTDDNLPAFFSTIAATEIQDVISCDNRICQYIGRLEIGCRLCVEACPQDAVTLGADGVGIDSGKCRECGACVAICPTGALQYQRFTDKAFCDYFQKVRLTPGTRVVVGDREVLHKIWWRHKKVKQERLFFLEYPNVHALSGMHFLLLFAVGAGRVVLVTDDDHQNLQDGPDLQIVNTIVEHLFSLSEFVVSSSLDKMEGHIAKNSDHPLAGLYEDREFNDRRRKVVSILRHVLTEEGRRLSLQQESVPWFSSLFCDQDRCSLCLACLNECKTGALTADPNTLALMHNSSLCVGCGVCLQVCPEDALATSSGNTIDMQFFSPRELARGEAMTCRECGKAFGTKKSYERVSAILSRLQGEQKNYLEYCDVCRVAKIFTES